ncbi:hypothetical protein DPMN_115229 [Dreissena polymorpha]|uniref:Histone-lysine N-methyltransferase SETMAR n=1 Tax=Dreissena polymorpha TaxID=45954 RepID=A0A9D4KMG0_DREPO|nr:hypothetical protein DPMN_115229 [Dreissena polymorpha]
MLLGKRPTIDASAVILHHDNASAHSSQSTELEIDVIEFQLLSHHPKSPEFFPYDFRFFPEVKSQWRVFFFGSKQALTVESWRIVSCLI